MFVDYIFVYECMCIYTCIYAYTFVCVYISIYYIRIQICIHIHV